jgi:hypothetical protein
LGKGTGEQRAAEAQIRQRAQEEDDVSRRPEEDCRRSASAVDESEGGSKEVSVRDQPPKALLPQSGCQPLIVFFRLRSARFYFAGFS